MRAGIWVLNIFAALWAFAAIICAHLAPLLVLVPAGVSGILLLWAGRQSVDAGNPVRGSHVARIVAMATGFEIIALVIVENILLDRHLGDAVVPSGVLIVGLHFFPLARWIPVPLYYRTAIGLTVAGLAGLLLPGPDGGIVSGLAAAVVLWASAIMLVRNGRGTHPAQKPRTREAGGRW